MLIKRFFLVLFLFIPAIAFGGDAPIAPLPIKVISIDGLISQSAQEYGLNRLHFYATLDCESDGFRDIGIQSLIPDSNGPNGHENSWGIAQIDLDYHPDISKNEAIDPSFAIDYAAHMFANGQAEQFHCWQKEKDIDWQILL